MKRRILILTSVLFVSLFTVAQNRPAADSNNNGLRGQQPQKPASGPKAYNEVITAKAKTSTGFFKVHKIDEKYFFEIADSMLGRDILIVNRIARAAAEGRVQMMGYAGDEIGKNVVRFDKGPNNKIFLKTISYRERSSDSSENGMYRSVLNSNVQPIVASFEIKALSKDSSGSVIDVTDFISSDNDILYFDPNVKRGFSLGQQMTDRSYIDDIKSFPKNIEIRVVKTFMKTPSQPNPGMPPSGAAGPATYELNSSLVLLPKIPMKPRFADARVGYFPTSFVDFDANPQGTERVTMITRWRLEPKPEDVEKYKRGEIVEPKDPIIFYIDPATPKKWVSYLILGVNDWQVAFEKAGWKNAIIAKTAPVNDPSWSLEGAGYSAIVYKPSEILNASGPHVHDPRSGEILETHVNWYHNVMNLLRNWYFVQASPIDPNARKMQFDDELMGKLIRFVSSHEIGHTLGLRHNYGSSSTVPVEKLRDKKWVEENGHTPSIMDYARFNYVAQPEDNISEKGIFPRIGDYDKWAIEWGYRWFPELKTAEEEKPVLNKWIIDKVGNNNRLLFGTETDLDDPRLQNEDLGDNAMKAGAYGIKNLQRIIPNLLDWTKEPNEGYTSAKSIYREVTNQFDRYMGHVTKYIGGIITNPKSVEEQGEVISFVDKVRQKEAMNFLQVQLFTTPNWLLDKKIFSKTGSGDINTISSIQSATLNKLMSGATIDKLIQFEALDAAHAYSASEMMNDLKMGIWKELKGNRPIDVYRRNLQKLYVEKLVSLLNSALTNASAQTGGLNKTNDALSIVKGHAKNLATEIKLVLPQQKDIPSRLHFQDVMERLNEALNPKS